MEFQIIRTLDDISKGVDFLCECEPAFGRVVNKTGLPPLRLGCGGLEGVLEIITEQQISIHAAAAIWERVQKRFAPFDLAELSAAGDEDYQACGLSRPKIRTIRFLLEDIANGTLQLSQLESLDDAGVAKALTGVKGIGPWTAQIYLLSHLGRSNVWPVGDLALQQSAKLLFDLDQRPDVKQMEELAVSWQPWRAVAARLLWSHYRLVRFEGGSL